MDFSRITILAGHYGSGKTNLALNISLALKKEFSKVMILDMDIVNPYFRTKDSEDILKKSGIRLISSQFANTNLDIPALPGEIYSAFSQKDYKVVVDVGGDDSGAVALGRFSDMLKNDDYEMILVLNRYRYFTQSSSDVMNIISEIEKASKLKFTSIINNSNLSKETRVETVASTVQFAREVSEISGLPIKFTSVNEEFAGEAEKEISDIFPIKIYKKTIWNI